MDFRIVNSGNENNISNDDLMFMQYSNYFGLNAIGKGLDENNNIGLTIEGCQLVASYTQADDTITAGLSDGYIVINGKQTKCLATASIQFACQYYMGYRRMAYIYAEVETRFNILGNKNYDDGQTKDTWQENRIKLSYSFSGTPLAGTVLIGSCYVGGTQGGTPSPIVVNQMIPTLSEAVINNTGNSDIITTHRGGRVYECVSVSNLYEVMGNWGIKRLTSSIKTNDYSFQFAIPAGADVYLLSAKADLASNSNYSYSNIDNISGKYNWFINKQLNTLTVSFDEAAGNYATCIVCLDRTL